MRNTDDGTSNRRFGGLPTGPPLAKIEHDLLTGDLPPLAHVQVNGRVLTMEGFDITQNAVLTLLLRLQAHMLASIDGVATEHDWRRLAEKLRDYASLFDRIAVNLSEAEGADNGDSAGQKADDQGS